MKTLDVTEFTVIWCANELTIGQIAELYESNPNAIRTVAGHLGLPRRGKGTAGRILTGGRWVYDRRKRIQVWRPAGDRAATG